MSNNNFWGPITWTFLHTILEKIKSEHYETEKSKILYFIKQICNNLPCPDCQFHASKYIKQLEIKHINDKEHFKQIIFRFHNNVNMKINKQQENETVLEIYKDKNTIRVFYEFVTIYSKPVHNNRLMMDSMNRNILMKELVTYFQRNVDKFLQ